MVHILAAIVSVSVLVVLLRVLTGSIIRAIASSEWYSMVDEMDLPDTEHAPAPEEELLPGKLQDDL